MFSPDHGCNLLDSVTTFSVVCLRCHRADIEIQVRARCCNVPSCANNPVYVSHDYIEAGSVIWLVGPTTLHDLKYRVWTEQGLCEPFAGGNILVDIPVVYIRIRNGSSRHQLP